MENKNRERETRKQIYLKQFRMLVDAGVTIEQIATYLGRQDYLLEYKHPRLETSIRRFDMEAFLEDNLGSLRPVDLPDVSVFLPESAVKEVASVEKQGDKEEKVVPPVSQVERKYLQNTKERYTITMSSLASILDQKEKFIEEVVRRYGINLKKSEDQKIKKLCMTSEDAQRIIKDVYDGILIDDWIFWSGYTNEVAQAMRRYIKKNKK